MNSLISTFCHSSPICIIQTGSVETETRVKLIKKGNLKKEIQSKSKNYSILTSYNQSYKPELTSSSILKSSWLYMNMELIIPLFPLKI